MAWDDVARVEIKSGATSKMGPYVTEISLKAGYDYTSCVEAAHSVMKSLGYERREYTVRHFVD